MLSFVLVFTAFVVGVLVGLFTAVFIVGFRESFQRRMLDVDIEWKEADGKFHLTRSSNGSMLQELAIYDCESQRQFFFNPSRQGKHRRRLICEKVD